MCIHAHTHARARAHTWSQSQSRRAVFTVWPWVLMWWDTQADNTRPEKCRSVFDLKALRQVEAVGQTQTEDWGQWGVLCAWLQTGREPRNLLAGQGWPLTQTQQGLIQCLRFFPNHTVGWKKYMCTERSSPFTLKYEHTLQKGLQRRMEVSEQPSSSLEWEGCVFWHHYTMWHKPYAAEQFGEQVSNLSNQLLELFGFPIIWDVVTHRDVFV